MRSRAHRVAEKRSSNNKTSADGQLRRIIGSVEPRERVQLNITGATVVFSRDVIYNNT